MPPVNIEALSLSGALAIAVIALWRKLDQKDVTIAEALRILERSAEASERSADASERSADAYKAMAEAMERLRASLPRTRKSAEP